MLSRAGARPGCSWEPGPQCRHTTWVEGMQPFELPPAGSLGAHQQEAGFGNAGGFKHRHAGMGRRHPHQGSNPSTRPCPESSIHSLSLLGISLFFFTCGRASEMLFTLILWGYFWVTEFGVTLKTFVFFLSLTFWIICWKHMTFSIFTKRYSFSLTKWDGYKYALMLINNTDFRLCGFRFSCLHSPVQLRVEWKERIGSSVLFTTVDSPLSQSSLFLPQRGGV